MAGLDYNSLLISLRLQPPFITIILKYWWGCSPSALPIPTALGERLLKWFQHAKDTPNRIRYGWSLTSHTFDLQEGGLNPKRS